MAVARMTPKFITCDDGHDEVTYNARLGEGTGCPACRALRKLHAIAEYDYVHDLECERDCLKRKVGDLKAKLRAPAPEKKPAAKRPKKKRA